MIRFEFALHEEVTLVHTDENGVVVGRAEFIDSKTQYLVRYKAGDGCQRESWWSGSAITASYEAEEE